MPTSRKKANSAQPLTHHHMGSRQYLLEGDSLGWEIVAGPFKLADDDGMEEALLGALLLRPWDLYPAYQILCIDSTGEPYLEEIGDDYLASLMKAAWLAEIDDHDDADYEDDEDEIVEAEVVHIKGEGDEWD